MNPLITQYATLFASSIFMDRITKHWVMKYLSTASVEVNRFFNVAPQWNRGVSFSWFHTESTVGFVALSLCIAAIVVLFGFYAFGQYRRGFLLYGEMLVLGGAISNLIDRVWFGGVLDFLDFHWGSAHFATFNLADAFIFIGVVTVFALTLLPSNVAHKG